MALGRMHFAPDVLWKMTLREIDMALNAHFGDALLPVSPDRETLTKLIQQYPDNKGKANNACEV